MQEITFALDAKQRETLEGCYKHRHPATSIDAYITDIESLLGIFCALARASEQGRGKRSASKITHESAARDTLRKADLQLASSIKLLSDLMCDADVRLRLDATFRGQMNEKSVALAISDPDFDGIYPGSLEAHIRDTAEALQTFRTAIQVASKLRKGSKTGGRPSNPYRPALVRKLGDLVRHHYNVKPATTAEGPFENLVRASFKIVGWPIEDIHRQVVFALHPNRKKVQ